MPRAALAEAFALEGCVLTPERAIEKGYVVVGADRTIASVSEAKPQGVPVHRTDGVICPGLIDLHGHPEFNIFAAWEPPREFVNRYAWRGSDLYKELVREPQNKLLGALPPKTQLRYAEIRALVGGVTAIQGTGGQATSYQDEALVRNVDKWIFGEQRGALDDRPAVGLARAAGAGEHPGRDRVGQGQGLLHPPGRGTLGQRALARGARHAGAS